MLPSCVKQTFYQVFVIVVIIVISSSNANRQSFSTSDSVFVHESKLIKRLLQSNYIKQARPVFLPTDKVNVSVSIEIENFEDLNERENIFTATILLIQSWKDPRLIWNTSEFGGLQTVKLPAKSLWTPDIIPYNAAALKSTIYQNADVVSVRHDGTIFWIPLMTVSVNCAMNMLKFPYDIQRCNIDLGSWSHSSAEMDITFIKGENVKHVDVPMEERSRYLAEHSQWELIGGQATATLNQIHYDCCNDGITTLSILCRLKRRASFYRYLVVGPSALLGLLVPVLFLLPSQSHDKTKYGLFIMLCVIVLIVVLQEAIPFSHGSVPRIGVFYLSTLILTSFSIILSALVSNLSVRGSRHRPLPAWIQSMFLGRNGLRRLLCVDRYSPVDSLFLTSLRGLEDTEQTSLHPEQTENRLEQQLSETNKCLQYIVGKMSADVSYDSVNEQWAEFACILDRILFFVFFILFTMTAMTLLT